ncbi:MAG: hypothetical protein Q8Q28_18090 [Pseudomonadota bacterium]|nr:hypothetical protein [Pseudomonadota bacterium]
MIGAQAGMVIAIHDEVHALVTAKDVSGRLPVVLDKLTQSLGLVWEETNGTVVVRKKRTEPKPAGAVSVAPAAPVVPSPTAPAVVAQAKQPETLPVPPQPAPALPVKPADPLVATSTPADKTAAAAAPKPDEPAKGVEPPRPAFTLKLSSTDLAAYALRDFLRGQGMVLVWGAGDVGSVATVAREYTGDTPLAVADAVLRAHGLHGIYARSDKTLYVR